MKALDADLTIIGGGPAGSAAAITAARLGLQVFIVEAARFPRFRPGETLTQSAAEMILSLIGTEAFDRLPKIEHAGVSRTEYLGWTAPQGKTGEPGVHIERAHLDVALLNAAARTGVTLLQPVRARSLDLSVPDTLTLTTNHGIIRCSFVIDASGSTQWLSRLMAMTALTLSNPLRVDYQYWQTSAIAPPIFQLGEGGWTWHTSLPGSKAVTAAMSFSGSPAHPKLLGQPLGAPRHANCTWRIARLMAGSRFALVGDAACYTDPASSRGVLRALSSGISAARAAYASITGRSGDDQLEEYCFSMTRWFLEDCLALDAAYRRASPHQDPVGFNRLRHSVFWGE